MSNFAYGSLGAPFDLNSTGSFTAQTLSGSGDQAEIIFQVPPGAASYTITRLMIRQGTTTGTPPTYQVSLQGVDGSGNPDGTIKSSTNAKATYSPSGANDGMTVSFTLTSSYAASPGEFLAIVVSYVSGTINGSNCVSVTLVGGGLIGNANFPYAIQNVGGSRTRQTNLPIYGWGTAGTVYGTPIQAINTYALTDASTPDEAGLKFTADASWGNTFQVAGFAAMLRFNTAAKTIRYTLYDTDGTTVLQQVDQDSDFNATAGSARLTKVYFDESSLATLNFGSAYRLSVKIIDATGTVTLSYVTCASSSDAAALEGGNAFALTSRTDAGSWTDDAASRPQIGLKLADWTEPASSGGVVMSRVFTGF